MAGLWRYRGIVKDSKNGKYLVLRRDGTIPEWPYFVLGAKDPAAPVAIRAYADACERLDMDPQYVADLRRMADEFTEFRRNGPGKKGDPDAPPHRKDDEMVVKAMDGGERVTISEVFRKPRLGPAGLRG